MWRSGVTSLGETVWTSKKLDQRRGQVSWCSIFHRIRTTTVKICGELRMTILISLFMVGDAKWRRQQNSATSGAITCTACSERCAYAMLVDRSKRLSCFTMENCGLRVCHPPQERCIVASMLLQYDPFRLALRSCIKLNISS